MRYLFLVSLALQSAAWIGVVAKCSTRLGMANPLDSIPDTASSSSFCHALEKINSVHHNIDVLGPGHFLRPVYGIASIGIL